LSIEIVKSMPSTPETVANMRTYKSLRLGDTAPDYLRLAKQPTPQTRPLPTPTSVDTLGPIKRGQILGGEEFPTEA
jgi:hypothetical protein